MSEAWRVLDKLVKLVREGRVDDSQVARLLATSGVQLTGRGQRGTYENGMLKVGAGVVTLDPASITDFSVPVAPAPAPAPAPVKPKPRTIDLKVSTDAKFEDDVK
jgi:hypothetical protein